MGLGQENIILSFSGFDVGGRYSLFLGCGRPLTTPMYSLLRAERIPEVTGICVFVNL